MSAQSAYASNLEYLPGQQVIVSDVVYQATTRVPPDTSPPNSDFWEVVDIANAGPGGVSAVVAGTNVTVDDSDAAEPVVSAIPGAMTLSLTYNAVTFDAPCWGVPAGWTDESIGVLGAQLTTGDAAVSGLEDFSGDPIPNGWTFPALIFVESGVIYDIFSLSAFNAEEGGLTFWTEEAGPPIAGFAPGVIVLPNMPLEDPGTAGQFYNDSGTVKVSAG